MLKVRGVEIKKIVKIQWFYKRRGS